MAEQKKGVIDLSPEDIECFKSKILKMRLNCQSTINSLKEDSEREHFLSLDDRALSTKLDSEKELLKQRISRYEAQVLACNNALCRIENGSFGICHVSKKPMSKEMLKANPLRTRLPEYDEKVN